MNNVISKNVDKFKSISVRVNFFLPLSEINASRNALLALVVKRANKFYESEKELEKKLALFYDAKLDVGIDKFSNSLCLNYTLECINGVKDIDVLDEALEMLYASILHPKVVNEDGIYSLDKVIVEREKQNLLQKIAEEKDNKRKYALKQLEHNMFKNLPYGISVLGDENIIINTSAKELYEHYNYMLKNSNIVVEVVGNLLGHENIATTIYNHILDNIDNNPCFNCEREVDIFEDRNSPEVIIEEQDINQSVLTIGCSLGEFSVEDTYKAMVYTQILGGSPASKLFQNVREKESLAYFAKAIYNRQKEVIYLFSGIAPQNYEKAKCVMLKQLDEIKEGNISEIELNAAKQNILFAYNDAKDSKEEYAKILLANEMYFKKVVEIEDILDKINNVSMQDVIDIANKVKVKQIFLLGGKVSDN